MDIQIHPGVKAVVDFMQRNIPADQLQGVAAGVAQLAPSLWGQYPAPAVYPLTLAEPPLAPADQ